MKNKPEVKKIEWSEARGPDDETSFEHVIGFTPLGDFLITWMSNNESKKFTLRHKTYGMYYLFDTVEAAKEAAQKAFEETVLNCLAKDKDGE